MAACSQGPSSSAGPETAVKKRKTSAKKSEQVLEGLRQDTSTDDMEEWVQELCKEFRKDPDLLQTCRAVLKKAQARS
eukprot:6426503-Lingulodinium_polyedra.AAC.1